MENQNQYEEQITKMLDILQREGACLNILICLTPTGKLRDKFTEMNIHRMEAQAIILKEINK